MTDADAIAIATVLGVAFIVAGMICAIAAVASL